MAGLCEGGNELPGSLSHKEWRVVTSRYFKFLPTTEINITNDEVFLPDMPINMINAGNFNKVYYMIGVTSREGIIIVQIIKMPRNYIRKRLPPNYTVEDLERIVTDVKNCNYSYREAQERRGVYCTFKRQAALSKKPVYVYMFSFSGYMNLYKERSGGSDIPGASHADELGYLYRSTFTNKTFVPGSPELEMSKRIVRLWANFVKTGNPTPETDPLLQNVAWKPLTKTEFPYLDIDTNLTLQHDLLKKAMNFWDQLTRNYTTHTC
ncbi:hypothetical protein ANN_18261 [Periplaneta americana]|uniref:Carboxylesterase type B domain-containing protein n=1 Tax=Periplaneta americana TaxID=6978 RepID=A0ABQ8SQD6_PERAM|nr:hypothetical protein ANN_18261 [Periplaneta americana]